MTNTSATSPIDATFQFVPTIEFFTALYRTANMELFQKRRKEWDNADHDSAESLLLAMYQAISPFLQRELKFFFGIRHVMVDQAFHLFAFLNPTLTSVPQLLEVVRTTETSVMLQCMMEDLPESDIRAELAEYIQRDTTFRQAPAAESLANPSSPHSPSEALSNFFTSPEGERIAECLANPEETKDRFLYLLDGFYHRAFKPLESSLAEQSHLAALQFQEVFAADPTHFLAALVQATPEAFKKDLVIHVSVLNAHGISSTFTSSPDIPDYLRLGMKTDSRLQKTNTEETVELFTKAIADKRRLEILRLLSHRRMYGQEIANQLQLTSAAVSYHMAFFFKLDLVYLEKQDNKVYFDLDHTRMAELFGMLRQSLIRPNGDDDTHESRGAR